jgi:hypothetical protein
VLIFYPIFLSVFLGLGRTGRADQIYDSGGGRELTLPEALVEMLTHLGLHLVLSR